jgi:hypothetical protein
MMISVLFTVVAVAAPLWLSLKLVQAVLFFATGKG